MSSTSVSSEHLGGRGGGGVNDDDKQDGEQEENYDMFTIFRSLENCYIIY